ncbi:MULTISPECIES: amidohydrolase family protein [Amycolatopsis]|uniref:metal-dependent hydrolase family protein n=1 Tax=Amycolatopsis TaxID=1813 RepID=UPI000A4D756E|nr:amidohydrolase family protein [Amycolatopsis sp. MJM2582]
MDMVLSAPKVLTGAGEWIPDGAVRVRDGLIAAVGDRASVIADAPGSVARFGFPRCTILPGLIDAHVHLAFDTGPEAQATAANTPDAVLGMRMAGRARRLLAAGVTTVRDLGDRDGLAIRLRDEIAEGTVAGPRIVAAGTPITITGGHCWQLGGEADGEVALRRAVRRLVRDGADLVKVMVTGGGITPDGPPPWRTQFTERELAVVVAEAARFGCPVAAHAHGVEGIELAVRAGVHSVEHASWLTEAGGRDLRLDVVADLAARGVWVCPTVSARWRSSRERLGAAEFEAYLDRLRTMRAHGVRMIAGTDAGVLGAPFESFVDGLEGFREAGFPVQEIIEMATARAAEALGIGDSTGRIATGMAADLLVVEGDPLAEISDLREVRMVIAAGRAYRPDPQADHDGVMPL